MDGTSDGDGTDTDFRSGKGTFLGVVFVSGLGYDSLGGNEGEVESGLSAFSVDDVCFFGGTEGEVRKGFVASVTSGIGFGSLACAGPSWIVVC